MKRQPADSRPALLTTVDTSYAISPLVPMDILTWMLHNLTGVAHQLYTLTACPCSSMGSFPLAISHAFMYT